MKQVEAAVIGTGWCGGIRAETLSRSALVDKLHICEIRPDRLAEVKALTKPATATLDYQDIIKNDEHLGGLYLDHAGDRPTIRSRATACAPARTCCWKSRSRWSCGRPTS